MDNSQILQNSIGFDAVAEELCLSIFSFLEAKDLHSLLLVNKRFYRLVDDPSLWRRLYRKRFFDFPLLPDVDGILTSVNTEKVLQDGSVWKKSYHCLSGGIHIYPHEDTHDRISRTLDDNPNALIFLTPGHHILKRPLRITSSPRILGIGSGSVDNIKNVVKLEVKLGSSELCLASPKCSAQISFITIGFKQIGHARSPLQVVIGARPALTFCNFINTSKMGWAVVASGSSTKPHMKNCVIPDGSHNGLLLLEADGYFEGNDFGHCSGTCMRLVSSSAVFISNWIRPKNKVKASECKGCIGGVFVSGRSQLLDIEQISLLSKLEPPHSRFGWLYWGLSPENHKQIISRKI